MRSSIWLWCYAVVSALGLGYNFVQLLALFEDPATIVSVMTMCVIAWQLPLYFLYGRGR